MEIINRYIYAVTKSLPAKQRVDIERELRSIIEDMLEQDQGPESNDVKVEKVLLELGDPKLLADNYRESQRYLIGTQNYDNYMMVLKIVFGAVFIGVSIATLLGTQPERNIGEILAGYIGGLISGLSQGFAWVTLSFAIAEYYGVKVMDEKGKKCGWSLSELPQIPEKKAVISRVESIFSLLFSSIFIILFWLAPELFAIYIKDSAGFLAIPIFNLDVLSGYRIFILAIFILNLLKEILKLISGRWTLNLSLKITALSSVSLVLALIIFSDPTIWNENVITEIMTYTNLKFDSQWLWGMLTRQGIIVVIVIYVLEIVSALYKGIKYNAKL